MNWRDNPKTAERVFNEIVNLAMANEPKLAALSSEDRTEVVHLIIRNVDAFFCVWPFPESPAGYGVWMIKGQREDVPEPLPQRGTISAALCDSHEEARALRDLLGDRHFPLH